MGDENLQNSYNDLLERYKSLSYTYSKMRTQAEYDTAKAKRTADNYRNAIVAFLLLGSFAVVKLLDAEFARGKASGIEYAKEELVNSSYERGYEDGKHDTLDEYSGDYDKGYDTGYEDAVSELEYEYSGKIDDVYDTAYEEGYEAGYEDGSGETPVAVYSGGYDENAVYKKAYENAADQLRHEYENEVADAYELGYEEGLAAGATFDYDSAWSDGYDYGYRYGISHPAS